MFTHAIHIAAAVGLVAALGGCAPTFPPIADTGGDAAFKARIADTYGPGTRAERLRSELEREGFSLLAAPGEVLQSAILKSGNLPCYSETRVDWRQDRRGRIVVIQAAQHDCT